MVRKGRENSAEQKSNQTGEFHFEQKELFVCFLTQYDWFGKVSLFYLFSFIYNMCI